MYFVYVLQSKKDNKHYIGCTNNLKRRIEEHESGKVEATKLRRPMKLIYLEGCLNKYDSYKREKYFKTGFGRRFVKERLKNYFRAAAPATPEQASGLRWRARGCISFDRHFKIFNLKVEIENCSLINFQLLSANLVSKVKAAFASLTPSLALA